MNKLHVRPQVAAFRNMQKITDKKLRLFKRKERNGVFTGAIKNFIFEMWRCTC